MAVPLDAALAVVLLGPHADKPARIAIFTQAGSIAGLVAQPLLFRIDGMA